MSSADIESMTKQALSAWKSQLHDLKGGTKGASREEIREKAEDFEAVFLTQVISEMFKGVKIGFMGGGFAEKMWREHLFVEYGKAIAQNGGVGVADSVEREILRMHDMEDEVYDGVHRRADEKVIRARAASAYPNMTPGAPTMVEPLPTYHVGAAATRLTTLDDKKGS